MSLQINLCQPLLTAHTLCLSASHCCPKNLSKSPGCNCRGVRFSAFEIIILLLKFFFLNAIFKSVVGGLSVVFPQFI